MDELEIVCPTCKNIIRVARVEMFCTKIENDSLHTSEENLFTCPGCSEKLKLTIIVSKQ